MKTSAVIQKYLDRKNMSWHQLNLIIKMHGNEFYDLKNDRSKRPNFNRIKQISEILEIDMNDFLDSEGDN